MPNSAICSIPGCGKLHVAKGYCNTHYTRLRKYGDPLAGPKFQPGRHKPLRPCSVDGCDRPMRFAGMCSAHYQRKAKYGDPLGGGPSKPGKGTKLRFVRDVVLKYEGDDCLLWPFPTSGRPSMFYRGHNIHACRVICELVYGEPPTERHHAAHSCGKGHLGCVTKRHLRWATPKENSDDMLLHGTKTEGEKCHKAILTASDVIRIRSIGRSMVAREIAEMFGTTRATISDVLNRRSWKHLA